MPHAASCCCHSRETVVGNCSPSHPCSVSFSRPPPIPLQATQASAHPGQEEEERKKRRRKQGTKFLKESRARVMGQQGASVGLEVLSGHFNLSYLGPSPKVTPNSSPPDKGPQKRDPEQTHPGSWLGMCGKHLKAGARVRGELACPLQGCRSLRGCENYCFSEGK